ncbi:hypothetical protein ABT363_15470, partial [Streptomyces sp. NPDC000188]
MASDRAAGLAATARALAEGDVSSRVLVEEALARIDATQPALNAFRTVRGEAALAEADAADRERAAGEGASGGSRPRPRSSAGSRRGSRTRSARPPRPCRPSRPAAR